MQLRPTACRAGRAMVSLVQNAVTGLVSSVLESLANRSLLLATVSHSTVRGLTKVRSLWFVALPERGSGTTFPAVHRGDTQLVYRTYWLLVDLSQSVRVKVPHQFF